MKQKNLFIILMVMIGSLVFTADLMANVTKVRVIVGPASFTGKCPKEFVFKGQITSDRAGIVEYKWIRSDGGIAPVKTIRFERPGTIGVRSTWTINRNYTGWKSIQIIAPNHIGSNRASFKLKCLAMIQPVQRVRPVQVRPVTMIRLCPDPAAFEIRFEIVNRTSQFDGRVRITGIVKNVGSKAFKSGPHQAKAYLYQLPPGAATGGTMVAQREFTNLAAGATFSLTYERNWRSSSPAEGEFPPSYRLLITYDPDIYMDNNKDNDDCNQGNNKKDRSGSEINDLFRH